MRRRIFIFRYKYLMEINYANKSLQFTQTLTYLSIFYLIREHHQTHINTSPPMPLPPPPPPPLLPSRSQSSGPKTSPI